jgi:ABC-type sugar transport system ATPase subunit
VVNTPVIEADSLRKAFGQVTALDGVSFPLPGGSVPAFAALSARIYARMSR